jgi:hypothetical protein
MISFMIVAADVADGHDVDAEAQQKFSVPFVPVCTSHWYKAKRLQVVVFKGVFFINLCLYQCTSI